jgi:hypothetical protein
MKRFTMTLIAAQTHLTPNTMRFALFGVALLLGLVTRGGASLDGFDFGGCGGG